MHENTPSAQQLRFMLPDVALHIDKELMLAQLRPLHLEFGPYDTDDIMRIHLANAYTLVLTAGETSSTSIASWVFQIPTTTFIAHTLEETIALATAGKATHRTTRVPSYTAYVRLEHQWDRDSLPVTHHLVQSPDPVLLVEDALTWCRHDTGLPLRWKHLGEVGVL